MSVRFLQLHALTSYPASLLNRDDAGFAKRIRFGGALRTRISSQCLKRHWRNAEGVFALGGASDDMAPSVRSRATFDLRIRHALIDETGNVEPIAEPIATQLVKDLMAKALGESKKAKEKKSSADKDTLESLRTEQVTVLGEPEVAYLIALARQAAKGAETPAAASKNLDAMFKDKSLKANVDALKLACGLDAALFGRMITGDLFARGDAAVHVAHAMTVHAEATEPDYFAVVDELMHDAGELGAGHVNVAELTTGLFYTYVVVDLPLLVSNIEGCKASDWASADHTRAREVVRRLVGLMATQSPGAKRGATAPYAYAQLMLAELGVHQPRTLANAFLDPVEARNGGLMGNAQRALGQHLSGIDAMYGATSRRACAAVDPGEVAAALSAEGPLNLAALANWAAADWTE
jgi:CRISPR system Cascade subunit CasC